MIITEEQFLKTMIETVKYEDYEPKSDLLAIYEILLLRLIRLQVLHEKAINIGKTLI